MRLSKGTLISATAAFLLLFALAGCQRHPKTVSSTPPSEVSAWARNPLWDDGLAEVALYEAKRTVYGKPRSFESVFITVKEDFSRKYYVKADSYSQDLLPVFKLNMVSSISTENYTYRYLTSSFVSRENPWHLVKLTTASQEWCGNTFKELQNWNGQAKLLFHSYFDGEGDGEMALHLTSEDLLEDQLPISLRSLSFKGGYRLQTRILDSLIDNRARPPRLANAEILVLSQERLEGWDAWEVEVKRDNLLQTYWFETAYPNVLLKRLSSDGRDLLLKEKTRRKYWVQ